MYERFIARQPILDEKLKLAGYELLFRAQDDNRAGSSRNLVAFALMPAVPADMNLVQPEGWNGFLGCGGRRDVVGWMVWGDAPRHETMMDFAIAPGQELAGIGFTSKRPPRRIRWFANTAVGREGGKVIWDCSSSATETMLKTPLQGTIVGPASDEAR